MIQSNSQESNWVVLDWTSSWIRFDSDTPLVLCKYVNTYKYFIFKIQYIYLIKEKIKTQRDTKRIILLDQNLRWN